MARYNEILAGRFNRALQKLLGMKGEAPAPQLSSEIMAILAMPSFPPELLFLMGWTHWAFVANVAAQGVGNQSASQLRNPTTSGVIAIIEQASVVSAVATDTPSVFLASSIADLATSQVAIRLDGRQPLGGSSLLPTFGTAAGGGNRISQVGMPAALSANLPLPFYVVAPGHATQIISTTTNIQQSSLWWWWERAIEESERT